MDIPRCSCSIQNPGDPSAPPKTFTFDGVYPTGSNTEQLYNEIAYPLVEGVLEGYNSTVFAYGQTGCGKSFTMQGVREPANQRGIIPRAFEHVFEAVAVDAKHRFLVLASYLEIYNEEIRDLLGPDPRRGLELRENAERGVYVHDLSSHPVQSVADCERLMDRGWRNRAVGATLMNAESSRSHSIFSISLEMMAVEEGRKPGLAGPASAKACGLGEGRIRRGKLNLVDLAGSERQAKTGATGERLKEAMKINLSLSALGNVISALVDGKSKHIPYRDSKLTRLLQDSLGGNTKTLMVACLSPADNNYDETLSTLRYANRAKNISNRPHINEDPKDTMLREYQDEIRKLKEMLASGGTALTAMLGGGEAKEEVVLDADKIRREYDQEMVRLREQYKAEQDSKAQLQADLHRLRVQFEENMAQAEAQKSKADAIANGGSPVSPGEANSKSNAAREKVLRRLQKLEQAMVGGERADDSALKERRMRRRRAAQQRLQMLSQVLAKVEDEEGMVLKVYDDIQEELRVKTEALRKNRQKVRALDREISDLQSEFENERTDYLETIRRQQRQLQLVNQILEKIVPTLRKECNYSNVERIKQEAAWSEDLERWRIPELCVSRTKLPPAIPFDNAFVRHALDGLTNGVAATNGSGSKGSSSKSSANGSASLEASPENSDRASSPGSDDGSAIILQKLARSEAEDIAGNYFKPRRANELLTRARAQRDAARVIRAVRESRLNGLDLHSSMGALNTVGGAGLAPSGGSGGAGGGPATALQLNSSWGSGQTASGWVGSPDLAMRKPARLEALPVLDRKRKTAAGDLHTFELI
ncbi:osmotic avoidance abnormal protein 3-like isoform X2 [Frankliniella occidentalis]|uniref:Kinesin-like protein n=1 Tax=Frankliniella occidentalis TaxID=133901 RepID=A0A9C6WQ66_FRAOC|nr:osmotic avoidance abnormal protein 3-like isoform X2 [Frankliniella occidentalis]